MTSVLPVVAMVFLCVTLIGFLLARSSTVFWGRYQEAFTEQARFNLADMFMFMDAGNLFRINVIALVLVPVLIWIATGNPLLAIFALVLILVLPK
jgi:tight adherence protein B